jgi:hypothetical protein
MRLWGIVLGCWCAASLAIATAQQVEFPLDYYSFAEIAQRMSIEGRRIECARDLRQRLALIHLQPRAWQQTRELLEKALDVRFRKISDTENRWILERRAEVAQLERQRRERLANFLDQKILQSQRAIMSLIDPTIPPEEVLKMAEQIRDDEFYSSINFRLLQNDIEFIKHMRSMPIKQAMRSWPAHERLQRILVPFMQTLKKDELIRFLNAYPLAEYGFSEEELQWAERVVNGNDEQFKNLRRALRRNTDNPQVMQAFALYYLGTTSKPFMGSWVMDELMRQINPPISSLDALQHLDIERVYNLSVSPVIAAWVYNDDEGVKVPLNSTEPFPIRLKVKSKWMNNRYTLLIDFDIDPQEYVVPEVAVNEDEYVFGIMPSIRRYALPRSLSPASVELINFHSYGAYDNFLLFDRELAQAYQKALSQHQNLLMNPVFQIPFPKNAKHFYDCFYRWCKAKNTELVAEVFPDVSGNLIEERTFASALKMLFEPYLIERQGSIWVLRHWAAFLHRVRDYPLASIRRLMRSTGSYEAWHDFYRSTTVEQMRWLLIRNRIYHSESVLPGVDGIHDLDWFPLTALVDAWLVMAILSELPPDQRRGLWIGEEDEYSLEVPLKTLPSQAQEKLARIYDHLKPYLLTVEELRLPHLDPYLKDGKSFVEHFYLKRYQGSWSIYLPSKQPTQRHQQNGHVLVNTILLDKKFKSPPK